MLLNAVLITLLEIFTVQQIAVHGWPSIVDGDPDSGVGDDHARARRAAP